MTPLTPPTALIDVPVKLRVLRCIECGLLFAADAAFYAESMKAGRSISCPAGHSPAVAWGDLDKLDMVATNLTLLGQLQQSARDIAAVKEQMLRHSLPPREVDQKELKRRAAILAERSDLLSTGDRLCKICGARKRNARYLKTHLMRKHVTELTAIDPAYFD